MIACTLLQPHSYLICVESVSRGLQLVPSVLFRQKTCPELSFYLPMLILSPNLPSPSFHLGDCTAYGLQSKTSGRASVYS